MSLDLVFLIDQPASSTNDVVMTLEEAGYLVWPLPDGAQALQLMERVQPDVLVLGDGIGRDDGLAFVEEVRALDHAVPVIVFADAVAAASGSMAPERFSVMTGPFDGQQVLQAVDRLSIAS